METSPLFDVVTVSGADAAAFLQSQFAADLADLVDGQLRWSALLNPQGRVLHIVGALRVAAVQWRLLVPYGRGGELVESLRRFVFRRKVRIDLDPTLQVCEDASGFSIGVAGLNIRLDEVRAASVVTQASLDRFVEAGLCLVDGVAQGRHLAHSLRLQRFDAFSVKKGCYPGQEIVARTHFLGRNKRELALLRRDGNVSLATGESLRLQDEQVGEVACVGGTYALAVLSQAQDVGTKLSGDAHGALVTVAKLFTGDA